MATARWALKHPVYGIVILRLGIYTNRPNVSKLCSFISLMNSSILISFIPENKLLASVPCFQKICLLFTNDLYFLTITCRPSRSFFLFPFCFIFIYSQNYTPMVLYEEIFLCISTLLYMTNFFCIRIGTLSLYVTWSNPIYIQRFFVVFLQRTPTIHTKVSLYTLVAHTHKNFFPYIIFYKNPSMHIFLFLYIRRHFIHYTSLFFIMILVHFIFRTTFLNEKNSTRFRNFYKHY